MARSFNEKMEKKRQAEYNRWKAECNPVWRRRNHWLPKYKEDGTLLAAVQAAELQIDTAGSI